MIGFVRVRFINWNPCAYALLCIGIPRVYLWVVSINYVYLLITNKVSLMTISLVSIEVNYHDATDPMMSPGIMYDEGNIRVYAEPTPVSRAGMMIPSGQVDRPAMLNGEA